MKVTLVRSRAIDPSINKIARALSANGSEVKLLVWDRQNTLKNCENEDYKICRFCLRAPYDKLSALFYLPIWWLYETIFLLKDNSDIIHVCDFDTLPPAILTKLLKNKMLFYMIYDFYSNNLPDGPANNLRKFIRFIVSSLEKSAIGLTDILFLVDECRLEDVKGAKLKKVVYIYNSPLDCINDRSLKAPSTHEVNIFYAGVIIKTRGLFDIIAAIQEIDGVKLTLAGIGPDVDKVKKLAKISKKIDYIGLISYDEVIKRSGDAEILFRFSDPNLSETRLASPNKLFEAMMFGKPIIVSDCSSMANIVRKENCGIVVPYGEIDAIKDAINRLRKGPELRNELGRNGRAAYEHKYSWKIMENRLISSYEEGLCNLRK